MRAELKEKNGTANRALVGQFTDPEGNLIGVAGSS